MFPLLGELLTCSGEEKHPETALWQAKELQQSAAGTQLH